MLDTIDTINKSMLGSAVRQKKNSSLVTIFAAVNAMVGAVILLIPVNWQDSGILFSTIAMVVIGLVQYRTCSWVVIVSKGHPDLSHIIQTYLGENAYKIFVLGSFLTMFGVGLVYFILLNSTLYQILGTIFYFSGFSDFASRDEITFKQFSIQWQCIAVMCVVAPLFFVKKMDFIVKIGRVGAVSIYLYIMLIIYLFIDNIVEGNLTKENVEKIELFTPNINNILGNFATAFQIHNSISEIMGNAKHPKKNPKNTKILFILVGCIYAFIGLMGTFALQGRKTSISNPTDIYDYFVDQPGNIPMFIVALVFFSHLITVQPFFNFIAKSQFKTLIFKNGKKESKLYEPIYNSIFIIVCLLIVIFDVDPNIVIGINGTVFGFIIVYYIPIMLRIKQDYILDQEEKNKLAEIEKYSQTEYQEVSSVSQNVSDPLLVKNGQVKIPKDLLAMIIFLVCFGTMMVIVQFLQIFGVL